MGLDLLLGGFVAGVIARIALKGREVEVLESKLIAVGYGFFIPFFFVVSGIKFDLSALTENPIRLLELPMFLGLFLIVRGVPALILYRGVLDLRDRVTLACSPPPPCRWWWRSPRSRSRKGTCDRPPPLPSSGAGILSTAILPIVGLRLRAGRPPLEETAQPS